jgi:hypothetical protein
LISIMTLIFHLNDGYAKDPTYEKRSLSAL